MGDYRPKIAHGVPAADPSSADVTGPVSTAHLERELVAKPLDLIRGQSRVAVDVFVGLWMTV